jgi:hypothetical protein
MNERIRELAEQAGLKVNADGEIGPAFFGSIDAGYKKFAELIVWECIARVEGCAVEFDDNYPNDQFIAGYNKGVSKVASQVKQHFGVEE